MYFFEINADTRMEDLVLSFNNNLLYSGFWTRRKRVFQTIGEKNIAVANDAYPVANDSWKRTPYQK